jgi:predicted nucleotidyltransferase component of viral defense system
MTALVERCAPRDLVDVYELVERKLVSTQECWALWKRKHPGLDVADAKATFAKKLAELVARTPVERFAPLDRERALERRRFFEGFFLA